MEKNIKVIMRYHFKEYYVEVVQEASAVVTERDYWLCKRGSGRKIFMFSAPFRGEEREERMISKRILGAISEFETNNESLLA